MRVAAGALGLVIGALAATASAEAPPLVPAPRLVVAPALVELGKFPYGPRTVHGRLTIRNLGDAPLEIRKIRSSCPCLTVEPGHSRLAPGASLDVRLGLDLGFREGRHIHPVTIYSNDPGRPVANVDVAVMVPMAVRFGPKVLHFGLVHKGSDLGTRRFDIAIGAQDGRALGPPRVSTTSPFLRQAEVVPAQGDRGPHHRVRLAMDPAIPLGEYAEWLNVETGHPEQPWLRLPVRWKVVGDLVAPEPVDAGLLEEGRPTTGNFTIRNFGNRAVTVLRSKAEFPFRAEVEAKAAPGEDIVVMVAFPDGPRPWSFEGRIDIHTDHPEQPRVTVRVVGKVWARDPLQRVGGEGSDAGLFAVLTEALLREDEVPIGRVLGRVLAGVPDDRVTSLLLRALTVGEPFPVRMRAAEALGILRSRPAVDALIRATTDDIDDDVRRRAATAVVQIIGRESMAVLTLLIRDSDELCRTHAAVLFGQLGDSRAIPLLRDALKDPEAIVREAAQTALIELGS